MEGTPKILREGNNLRDAGQDVEYVALYKYMERMGMTGDLPNQATDLKERNPLLFSALSDYKRDNPNATIRDYEEIFFKNWDDENNAE